MRWEKNDQVTDQRSISSLSTEAAEPGGRSSSRFSLRLSARDLLRIAIFSVVFIAVGYAIGMLGFVSPVLWLLSIPASILVNGITYLLFVSRVRHAGMVTLFGIVVALFYLLGGNSLIAAAGEIALGILADLLLLFGSYRSVWASILSYTVFGLADVMPFVPPLFDQGAYFTAEDWPDMGSGYAPVAEWLLSLQGLGVLALVCAAAAFLGGLLGAAMLRKHFVRAGLA